MSMKPEVSAPQTVNIGEVLELAVRRQYLEEFGDQLHDQAEEMWEAFRDRLFTLNAGALPLSFLAFQVDERISTGFLVAAWIALLIGLVVGIFAMIVEWIIPSLGGQQVRRVEDALESDVLNVVDLMGEEKFEFVPPTVEEIKNALFSPTSERESQLTTQLSKRILAARIAVFAMLGSFLAGVLLLFAFAIANV